MESMKVLELFSGIGGMHYALKKSKIPYAVIAAVDINPIANHVYTHNFPNTVLHNRNVQFVNEKFVEKNRINTILMSPPCQPFTRVGNQKDVDDPRTDAFVHICSLIPTLTTVSRVLMENVKGFETSKARDLFVESLTKSGYCYQEFLLSPATFGVPNSRTRYFCIARKGIEFDFGTKEILEKIPSYTQDTTFKIYDILDDGNLPLLPDDILLKRNLVMDICHPESISSTCFTKAYSRYIEGTGSLFTPKSQSEIDAAFQKRENESEFLIALKDLNLRFFSPREVARLMSFPGEFNFPDGTTDKQKYRLLGNSLNVLVVSELIKLLCIDS